MTTVDADEAHRIGLVYRVVPEGELESETAALAERLAAMPSRALGWIKRSRYASFASDLPAVLEAEAEGQATCGYSEDHTEGLTACLEKRKPRFKGR